jgi:hypothetical protein
MEQTLWSCYLNCRSSRTLRLGAAMPVMSLHLLHRRPPEHWPPRNPDPSIAQPNAPQSCLPKRPRSPGPLQSSHSRVYLPDFIPATARSFRWESPGAAAHNISRTRMGILYMPVSRGRIFLTASLPCLPPWFLRSSPYIYPTMTM